MEKNLIEQIKRQREHDAQQLELEKSAYEKQHAIQAFQMFSESLNLFVTYIEENNYDDAKIRTMQGEEYLTYPLFGYRVYDNELFYEGSPISLAIDKNGATSFMYEVLENRSYVASSLHFPEPRPYPIATSCDSYIELAEEVGDKFHSDDLLVSLAIEMQYDIAKREYHKKHRSLMTLHEDFERRRDLRNQLIEMYFPDGNTFEEYRTRFAERARQSEESNNR